AGLVRDRSDDVSGANAVAFAEGHGETDFGIVGVVARSGRRRRRSRSPYRYRFPWSLRAVLLNPAVAAAAERVAAFRPWMRAVCGLAVSQLRGLAYLLGRVTRLAARAGVLDMSTRPRSCGSRQARRTAPRPRDPDHLLRLPTPGFRPPHRQLESDVRPQADPLPAD